MAIRFKLMPGEQVDVVHATRQVCRPAEKTAEKQTARRKFLIFTFMQTRLAAIYGLTATNTILVGG